MHSMSQSPLVLCDECEAVMHRVPQTFSVVWGGLPPHLADARPKAIQEFIDTEHKRRDEYIEKKERNSHG